MSAEFIEDYVPVDDIQNKIQQEQADKVANDVISSGIDDGLGIYKNTLRSGNWMTDSKLPDFMEEYLPLRQMYNDYFVNNTVLPRGRDTIEPECRMYADIIGRTYVPRIYNPITFLPMIINKECKAMRYSDESGLKGMIDTITNIAKCRTSWYIKCASLQNVKFDRITKCYDHLPLSVFPRIAIDEVNIQSHDPIWDFIYDKVDDLGRRPGVYGTIQDNSLIDMRPIDSFSKPVSTVEAVELRKTKPHWRGFIDCSYTPFNTEAGQIRAIVHGCRYRVMSKNTLSMTLELLHCIKPSLDNDYILYFAGIACKVGKDVITSMINKWRTFRSKHCPSLHIFNDVVTISIQSGCIMKPINLTECIIHWVDSICYHNTTMLKVLTGITDNNCDDVSNNLQTLYHLFPYILDDEPPRPALGASMSMQAICRPRVELTSTIASNTNWLPIVRTPMMQQLIEGLADHKMISVPGCPLLVVYANMKDNYEDSVIVSERVNDMELFSHTSIIHHPIPNKVGAFQPGDIITDKDHWYRPHSDATVVKEGISATKWRFVTTRMECNKIYVGDKIATAHGQKLVVSGVWKESDMPTFVDSKTGKVIKPHIIMAATSIHNRGTNGQIYEGWKAMSVVNDVEFNPKNHKEYCVVDTFTLSDIPEPYTCNVLINGTKLTKTISGETSYVIADYGIVHFWLLSHIARDKQHYMSVYPNKVVPKAGRLHGSGVRFGELENISLAVNGLNRTLSYLSDTGDLAEVPICIGCDRLLILCDCPTVYSQVRKVRVRNALVRLDIYRAVYSMNAVMYNTDNDKDDSIVDGRHSNDKFIAESFKYKA